jgi:hypothetical protein
LAKTQKRPTPKPAASSTKISPVMIGVVAVAAVLIVGGLILLGNQSKSAAGPIDLSPYAFLGSSEAAVTLVDFSDYG